MRFAATGNFWGEVAAVQDHGFTQDDKVSLAHFDDTHELLWTATDGGRVCCHSVPSLQLVSSVTAWQDEIRDIAVLPEGRLLVAGSRAFKLLNWGGLSALEHHEQNIELVSCCRVRGALSSAALATSDGTVMLWDLSQKACVRSLSLGVGLTHVRQNPTSPLLAVGTEDGKVGMLDTRDSSPLSGHVTAHPGGLGEICFAADSLATCGFRQSPGYGGAVHDSIVRVFDVRHTVRPVSQIHFSAGALCVALHPRLHGTLMITSPNAVFGMADIGSGSVQQMFEVSTDGHMLGAGCLSSTGTCIAFASHGGFLHLWSNTPSPVANAHSVAIDIPLSRLPQPATSLQETSSFAVPGFYKSLLQCSTPLASDLEANAVLEVGLPPRVLEAPVLKPAYSQVNGGVYHVRNPHYVKGMAPGANTAAVAGLRNNRAKQQETVADADAAAAERKAERRRARAEAGGVLLPSAYQYRMIPVRKKQKAFVDLDFAAQMTNTIFSGLENLVPNSYCNALVQVFYFQPVFRARVLARKPNPAHEMSLLDEFRFLFQMLYESNRVPCQASNLLRLLKRLPEAASVGLLEAQEVQSLNPALDSRLHMSHERSLARRVVKLSRFCLDMLHKEVSDPGPPVQSGDSWVESLFGMHMLQHVQCVKLPDCRTRNTRSMQLDLQYPTQAVSPRLSFAEIVQRSIVDDKTLKMWYDEKLAYQLTRNRRCPLNLPPVLVINTELHKRSNLEFWQDTVDMSGAKQPWLPWAISIDVDQDSMAVRVQQSDHADDLLPGVQQASAAGLLAAHYVLTGVICHIRDEDDIESDKADEVEGSLIAQVRVLRPYLGDAPSVTLPGWGLTPTSLDKTSHALVVSDHVAQPPGTASHGPFYTEQDVELSNASPSLRLPEDPFTRTPSPSQNLLHQDEEGDDDAALEGGDSGHMTQHAADGHFETPSQSEGGDAWERAPPWERAPWVIFNDFTVTECDAEEVRDMFGGQKVPCVLLYTKESRAELQVDHLEEQSEVTEPPQLSEILTNAEFAALCASPSLQPAPKRPKDPGFTPLNLHRTVLGPDLLLAIDAEFVALTAAQKKLLEGREIEVKPMAMCLARVSVVVGSGPQAGITCIDDRICMVDNVYDYLTKFSGLRPGDLQPSTSKHYLTTLKRSYMKLRYLVDKGCVFVGHGLRQDFRMINLTVPPAQIIDTVELFRSRRKRMLSLRFLMSYLLRRQIQISTHDSTEDAYAALHLYEKYRELKANGQLEATLDELYNFGAKHNYQPAVWRDGVPYPLEPVPA